MLDRMFACGRDVVAICATISDRTCFTKRCEVSAMPQSKITAASGAGAPTSTGSLETSARVLPDGCEQAEAIRPTYLDERLLRERLQDVDSCMVVFGITEIQDRLGGEERAASVKDGELGKRRLLDFIQEVPGPVERRLQGGLASPAPDPGGQDREPIVHSFEQRRNGENGNPRRCKFDGERKAFEHSHQPPDQQLILLGDLELGKDGTSTAREQLEPLSFCQDVERKGVLAWNAEDRS